jgi:hypothetical protein
MINRDEGCNKVDCLLCGYRFCWRCGSGWSQQKCGFYQCGEEVVRSRPSSPRPVAEKAAAVQAAKPEESSTAAKVKNEKALIVRRIVNFFFFFFFFLTG